MAISWVAALKLVPWADVIQAAPTVLKAAKGLMNKTPHDEHIPYAAPDTPSTANATAPADNAGELALQYIAHLETRLEQMEAAQRASAQVLEKMAEQQAQIVQTVGLLRTGATRLAWACGALGATVIGLVIYIARL